MLQATWDWYYGSTEEELLGDCQFGKPYFENNEEVEVIVRPGTYENGDAINIFTTSQQANKNANLETCAKHLKVLRHPNILRFVTCMPMELEYHLVTEHAYPLQTLLDSIDAHEICSGLHDVALALQFIHDKAQVTHNNVCIRNIYVHDNGPWKLAGFEYACRFDEATKQYLEQNSFYNPPPEEKISGEVTLPLPNQHGHCRDVYSFGVLLKDFFDKVQFSTAMLKDSLQEVLEDIMREDHENRPTMKEILTMPVFKSAYISIVHFLQSITLRSSIEKDNFFKTMVSKLDMNHIFAEVVGRRIVPLLLTPIVLAEQSAIQYVLKDILTPASEEPQNGIPLKTANVGVLPESVFARYVIPKIVELFKSRLIHVRLVLLENFSKYVHLFESSVLNDIVLPEIITGLHDTSNQIVQFSLHALADAVAVVGADVIVGEEREKIFSLGVPKFDGRALNESRALAYEEKIAPRKKVEKKLPPAAPRKPTLLELAMLKKSSTTDRPAPTVEVLLKQKRLAHDIAAKSQVSSNGLRHQASPTKSSRPPIVVQEVRQPDVETWASSTDDDSDTQWPEIEETPAAFNGIETPPSDSPIYPLTTTDSSWRDDVKENPKQKSRSVDSSPHRSRRSQSGVGEQLGNEFEINVDQSKYSRSRDRNGVDFFADMEPDIKAASRISTSNTDESTPVLKHSLRNGMASGDASSQRTEINFQASNVDDEEEGWSDDGFNWE